VHGRGIHTNGRAPLGALRQMGSGMIAGGAGLTRKRYSLAIVILFFLWYDDGKST
jgi:hypothetical protein